jgi:hypothetical protein
MNIAEDNKIQLERFKNLPPNPSYLSGFIDGDGCVFIRKIKNGYQSGISLTQCRTNILQIIRYHFGGTITSASNKNDKINDIINSNGLIYKNNIRNQYNIIIRSNEYEILVNYIKDYMVIKKIQIDCLNKFYKLVNKPDYIEEKETLYDKCSQINKTHILDLYNLEKINYDYISGLFDAEGCFYINCKKFTKFYISITQKNNPIILEEISKKLGFGIIDFEKRLKIYKKEDCLKFIELVKNNLIVKYNQAIAFELFLQTNDFSVKENMYKICNKEKHQIEVFSDLNNNDNGKDMFYKTLHLIQIKKQICKEIYKNQLNKEKSKKMKGKGNHNYGKTFSKEIRQKMSNSIKKAKNSVSDEIITQVRNLIQETKQNVEIQKILNLPRHTITKIKNGTIVCSNEEKVVKQKLSPEDNNILRRKITLPEILVTIDKIIDNWKPMKILDYLQNERIKNNIQTNLTIDIIKNIKRNISVNKLPIYKKEIDCQIYNKYITIISEYCNKNKITK